jgi:hypothetical protein
MRYLLPLLLILTLATVAHAGHLHKEAWYQARWCAEHGGQTEVVMPDGTRCDCLTDTHAVEFDFSSKWAESIGQALLYGAHTGKRPGIVLIIENEKELGKISHIYRVIEAYGLPIDVWTMKP